MHNFRRHAAMVAAAVLTGAAGAGAQDADPGAAAPPPPRPEPPAATADPGPDAAAADALLTEAELEKLVAPVALYPDTLLIQILVGATQPLDVVKAERFLTDNAGADPAALKPEIEAQDWDPSVEVLATAFPEVVSDMATHIEWTETMGDAMLAQSDDVMSAVQVMRRQAINTGALMSGPEQTVVEEPAADGSDVVVIAPTNPQTVYVPQYVPQQVYPETFGLDVTDLLVGGAITFGAVSLIDEIFDDDDDWDDYWGCRNCGGWDGGPIIRDPNVDIDVDGDVTINGREVGFDRGDRDLTLNGERVGWAADSARRSEAQAKIAEKRAAGGAGLKVERPEGRTDALRAKLSGASGAADISRGDLAGAAAGAGLAAGAGAALGAGLADRGSIDRANIDRANIDRAALDQARANGAGADRPRIDRGDGNAAAKAAAIRDTHKADGGGAAALRDRAAAGEGGGARLNAEGAKKKVAKKPAAQTRAATLKADGAKMQKPKGQALQKNASANRTKAAAHRGKQVKGKNLKRR